MKASHLWNVEATWEAFKHDLHLLELVRKARTGGVLEIRLDGQELFGGIADEPHDLERWYEIRESVRQMAEQYLEATLHQTRMELAGLGLEVDV